MSKEVEPKPEPNPAKCNHPLAIEVVQGEGYRWCIKCGSLYSPHTTRWMEPSERNTLGNTIPKQLRKESGIDVNAVINTLVGAEICARCGELRSLHVAGMAGVCQYVSPEHFAQNSRKGEDLG